MSTTTLAPSAELPRLDWPFLIAAVLGTAVLVALVALDGHPASAALVILGFALGAAFLKTEFSFTAAWRRFLVKGEAGGMLGALLLTAVASLVIVPVAALVPGEEHADPEQADDDRADDDQRARLDIRAVCTRVRDDQQRRHHNAGERHHEPAPRAEIVRGEHRIDAS